jgi:outer membrane protein assembly factor BamA
VSQELTAPSPWTEFTVEGDLLDSPQTVQALLQPTMQARRTTLTNATWIDIAAMAARFGYQLVDHRAVDLTSGKRLVLQLAPLPIVRSIKTRFPTRLADLFGRALEDEVRRRVRLRPGSYLPWEPIRRQCAVADDRQRIEEYLYDEGYADATVKMTTALQRTNATLIIEIDLGKQYRTGTIAIAKPVGGEPLAISDAEIRATFRHNDVCLPVLPTCFSTAHFTRTQHQEDVQRLRELFHRRGYPAVRVQSSFDPKTSFDRRTHTVNFTLTIDQRRLVDVQFEGADRDQFPAEELRKYLTFDSAGSSDDVEVASSAAALTAYLQTRGFFDARVTVERQRGPEYDKIAFRIDQGPHRDVHSVRFSGNHAISSAALGELVATKPAGFRGTLLGTNTAATAEQLAVDVTRIKDAYRRIGYRDTRVVARASSEPQALDSPALTAALVLAERGDGVHVGYAISEGEPTVLSRIAIDLPTGSAEQQTALCAELLRELASELHQPLLASAKPNGSQLCSATTAIRFREDDVAATRERLRELLFRTGRPRATVGFEAKPLGPKEMSAHYTVRSIDPVRVGKIVVRGAFRTSEDVIFGELPLREGDLLTSDALAEGARRLRNTGLFNAVNIDLPDLCGGQGANQSGCQANSLVVNAVVRVEERFDNRIQIDLQGGYSSYNSGPFAGIAWRQGNLFGRGIAFRAAVTAGTRIIDVESTLRFPPWLVRPYLPLDFRTEVTGLVKQQVTPRFGLLKTEGVSVALAKPWLRQRSPGSEARAITLGIQYDFRLRTREVDALRPIGANLDTSRVAVGTRTGSVGVRLDWEQRVDRRGNLAPLSPESGHRLELSASLAHPYLYGQDAFVKVSASGSKFVLVGDNLVLRADLRYDQGIPLGGAVLLPEVERFFAGGDSTVRGYRDDRLATELIEVPVPPIGNLSQIRIVPAGGNIRVLGSLDAQLRIWNILAGALFADAGMISNDWSTVDVRDVRPGVGTGLRLLTPFGIGAFEYAIPLRPNLGDEPRGRIHFYFAARAQF